MKKMAILVLSFGFLSASYAQDHVPATLVNDNVNKEQKWNEQQLPKYQEEYALMDKGNDTKSNGQVKLTGNNKPDLFNLNKHMVTNSSQQFYLKDIGSPDIKPVVFPKTKKGVN